MSCTTSKATTTDIELPNYKQFKPSELASIRKPLTQEDLLYNWIQTQKTLELWQSYSSMLESILDNLNSCE